LGWKVRLLTSDSLWQLVRAGASCQRHDRVGRPLRVAGRPLRSAPHETDARGHGHHRQTRRHLPRTRMRHRPSTTT